MRVDLILQRTELKKGALYHHFTSKQALGYAVVDELIRPMMERLWLEPLAQFENPAEGLLDRIAWMGDQLTAAEIELGCPVNNLAQEMSPVDEGFRTRIQAIYQDWQGGIAKALQNGQRHGHIAAEVDPQRAALFFVAAVEGCLGLAKSGRSTTLLCDCAEGLRHYVATLRSSRSPR